MSNSVTGLSEPHRAEARRIIARGAKLLLAHAGAVHYSQGPDRWEGIAKGLRITKDQYPKHGDCSSTATWLLWNALVAHFPSHPIRDIVNGAHWAYGYTGTMLQHGKVVVHEENILVGDLLLYGVPGTTGKHVAVALGGGKAFSHGSEAGPFKVDIHYRGDLLSVRRYV